MMTMQPFIWNMCLPLLFATVDGTVRVLGILRRILIPKVIKQIML
jgi:hypothetical protein